MDDSNDNDGSTKDPHSKKFVTVKPRGRKSSLPPGQGVDLSKSTELENAPNILEKADSRVDIDREDKLVETEEEEVSMSILQVAALSEPTSGNELLPSSQRKPLNRKKLARMPLSLLLHKKGDTADLVQSQAYLETRLNNLQKTATESELQTDKQKHAEQTMLSQVLDWISMRSQD